MYIKGTCLKKIFSPGRLVLLHVCSQQVIIDNLTFLNQFFILCIFKLLFLSFISVHSKVIIRQTDLSQSVFYFMSVNSKMILDKLTFFSQCSILCLFTARWYKTNQPLSNNHFCWIGSLWLLSLHFNTLCLRVDER